MFIIIYKLKVTIYLLFIQLRCNFSYGPRMSFYENKDFSELISWLCRQSNNKACRSYAGLARRLKIKSPRTLGMIAKRQRAPSFSLVKKISHFIEATPQQKDFLLLLAEKSKCLLTKHSIDEIEEKLQRYHQMKQIIWNENTFIEGVKIEFESHVDKAVRDKLEEVLRFLSIDHQDSKTVRK